MTLRESSLHKQQWLAMAMPHHASTPRCNLRLTPQGMPLAALFSMPLIVHNPHMQAAPQKAASSCSYAAAMMDDGTSGTTASSNAGQLPSSCPMATKTDAAGTPLNPLTNMPLAIYDSSSSTSSSTQPQQKQPWRPWHLFWRSKGSTSSSTGSNADSSTAAQSSPTLSTARQKSSIPMALPPPGDAAPALPHHQKGVEGAGVWMYPSETMFYNAMKRKVWRGCCSCKLLLPQCNLLIAEPRTHSACGLMLCTCSGGMCSCARGAVMLLGFA